MKVYVEGLGLRGPGLLDWPQGRAVLAGQAPLIDSPTVLAASELLPPAERRRTTDTVKLALAVGTEAMAQSGLGFEATPSVFTSSGGDGVTITAILETLATPLREVSPTRFHNSVHNAPAGYWGIATQSHAASTSLCGFDYSFAAGLIEAAAQALCGAHPVLLVAYDVPYPGALGLARPMLGPCGIALVLSPAPTPRSLAMLTVALDDAGPASRCPDPALEALRAGNPAARGLPLLQAFARDLVATVQLPYVADTRLRVDTSPLRDSSS